MIRKGVLYVWNVLLWESEVILELKILIFHHNWGLVKRQFQLENEIFTRQESIFVPNGPRPQRKTFSDIFWQIFIISGLYRLLSSLKKKLKMAIFESFGQRVLLVLSMREFNSKTIVLNCVRIISNSGSKIPVSFFTELWSPTVQVMENACRRFSGQCNSMDPLHGRFHLRFHSIV